VAASYRAFEKAISFYWLIAFFYSFSNHGYTQLGLLEFSNLSVFEVYAILLAVFVEKAEHHSSFR